MEHNLLCSYLYAAFSLRGEGEGLSPDEARAVKAWRQAIVSVAIQEMGHLATVNNLAVAVGGEPHFDRPNFPVPPGYHPAGFELRLTPFNEATLEHFIFLERPEDAPVVNPAEFEDPAQPPREAARALLTPSARDYETIGALYEEIGREVRLLAGLRGARTFCDAERQLSAEDSGLAGVVVIRDLDSALAALKHIVEQGEGGRPGAHDSHFARFCAIRDEWARLRERNPAFAPAHPVACDPVMRRPAAHADRVWITARPAADLVDLGNALYGAVLLILTQAYQPGEPAKRKATMGAAIELMQGLSHVGTALARLRAAPDDPGVNAGLTFAVPRTQGARRAALLDERLSELVRVYADLVGGAANPVEKARRAIAAA